MSYLNVANLNVCNFINVCGNTPRLECESVSESVREGFRFLQTGMLSVTYLFIEPHIMRKASLTALAPLVVKQWPQECGEVWVGVQQTTQVSGWWFSRNRADGPGQQVAVGTEDPGLGRWQTLTSRWQSGTKQAGQEMLSRQIRQRVWSEKLVSNRQSDQSWTVGRRMVRVQAKVSIIRADRWARKQAGSRDKPSQGWRRSSVFKSSQVSHRSQIQEHAQEHRECCRSDRNSIVHLVPVSVVDACTPANAPVKSKMASISLTVSFVMSRNPWNLGCSDMQILTYFHCVWGLKNTIIAALRVASKIPVSKASR